MAEAILSTLSIMKWLGIVLGMLVAVNTVCHTVTNIQDGESFSIKKLLKGIGKSVIFYGSAVLTSVAFTMLPYINEMITTGFGVELISSDLLNTLSSVAVLAVVTATVVIQGKKALLGVIDLSNMSTGSEEITWDVVDPETEEEK